MATVTLANISKSFGQGPMVVDDFSLDVSDGELVVLFGPSGCGKTTALRMIAGLEPLSKGSISIGDRCVESAGKTFVPPAKRNTAMVFQNQALYPHLDVFANLAFGLKMRGTDQADIDRRVGETAELLGLESLLHRRPSQLSGGQRQRVALGRALARQADVYLMDEPLSSLDGPLRDNLRHEIRHLHNRLGTTMLWVTHHAVEAMALADRIVVMRQAGAWGKTTGVIQQIGTPASIYESPANRFTAAMIGRPGVNIMPGILKPDGNRLNFNGKTLVAAGVDSICPKLKDYVGQTIEAGVRPEDVTIARSCQQTSPEEYVMEGKVNSAECFGRECLLYIDDIDGTTFETGFDAQAEQMQKRHAFVVSLQANPSSLPPIGEKVNLAVDSSRLLFFDRETGQALY